jgi:hypothetical protein
MGSPTVRISYPRLYRLKASVQNRYGPMDVRKNYTLARRFYERDLLHILVLTVTFINIVYY